MEEAKSQILLWTQPEYPYRVSIPAAIINEIRILAVEAFYSVPRGGVEIGGVFFGVRHSDHLEIRATRPIRCQYATGPSFTLSVSDQLGLSGLLESTAADPDLEDLVPVGWYHSHTRSEIFLSAADLQIYNEFFPERWQIAMVLRPVNLQPTRGGIFFRNRMGAIRADAPLQEFKLEPPNFGLTPVDGEEPVVPVPLTIAAAVAEAAPVIEPPTLKAPSPRLVPNRELQPKLEPKPQVDVHEKIAAATDEIRQEPKPAPLETFAALAANGSGSAAVSAVVVEPPAPVTAPLPDPIPFPPPSPPSEVYVPSFLAVDAPRDRRNNRWIWAIVILVLLAAGGGAAFWKWGALARGSDLGLETYDINGSFLIRWDRESRVIRNSTHAIIEIQDGADKTPIELSRGELAVGGYGYVRRTGQVSVHMKVEGDRPVEEYSNFNSAQALGSQLTPSSESGSALQKTNEEKEHLKTELINESMQSLELRKQITDLKRQLAEERAKDTAAPK